MKRMKKIALLLFLVVAVYAGLQAWNDEKLFTTTVGGAGKYNVLFVQDFSGSMSETLYHPDFDPNSTTYASYSTVTIPNLTQTSWFIRWGKNYTIGNSSSRALITNWNAGTSVLTLRTGYGVNTRIKANDWILQYRDSDGTVGDDAIEFNLNYQMVAQVDNETHTDSGSYRYTYLTLDAGTIKGTPQAYSSGSTYNYVGYYSDSTYTTRIVKLYGTAVDDLEGGQNSGVSYGSYNNGPADYKKWLFGAANDAQRQQVSDLTKLGYDIEYNCFLIPTTDPRYPVSPVNAHALEEDYPTNSNGSETLLDEWNEVNKAIYPNKVANLMDALTTTATTVKYYNAKESLASYQTYPFYIKIDAETMRVTDHVPDPENEGNGTFTVTRAQSNTLAATHASSNAVMIFDNEALNINEYVPLTHLFSSMQHVTESTGDVDPAWTSKYPTTGTRTIYRYKRVFTRLQTVRESLCDVVTSKNKLFNVAELAGDVGSGDTTLLYSNATVLADWAAPFYIKVVDADGAGNEEIMQVTAHNPAVYSMTVSRGQQGTSACDHAALSKIMAFKGPRDMVRIGVFVFPRSDPQNSTDSAWLQVPLSDFGLKNADGSYATAAYINGPILDSIYKCQQGNGTPLAKALSTVWNYLKPNNNAFSASTLRTAGNYSSGYTDGSYIRRTGTNDWFAVDSSTFGTNGKFELLSDGLYHPKGSPMEYWCQKNIAVMVTDGDATADENMDDGSYGVFYSSDDSQIMKTSMAGTVVSDFFKFNYNLSRSLRTPWGDTVDINERSNSEFLPDTAYFLAHQDMFPTVKIKTGTWDTTNKLYTSGTPEADITLYDESNSDPYQQWPTNQNISTYTVGLCVANDVLTTAARNGGGINFTAYNYKDLTNAFESIVSSVSLLSEPMTYTTYAAPKQSITGGRYGYVAHFVPQEKAMWEGHLRRFLLTYNGDFPANIDTLDEDTPGTVEYAKGMTADSFQWDAAVVLSRRTTDRIVYTGKNESGSWQLKDFMSNTDVTATDLGVGTTAQRDQVKKFVQDFRHANNTPITEYAYGYCGDTLNYKYGETFHFNPQLVGYPLKWKVSFDSSYASFYERYSDEDDPTTLLVPTPRKEVVYSGANDGKLHCFQASDGAELWGYVPYFQLTKLKDPALNPLISAQHTYFVDGKAVVKDIKVSSTYTDYRDWKTGLFFGMGIGGRSYCALDVTNPDLPEVLWEFDDGYSADNLDGRMGFTEAKPIVVDMNAGTYGTFPGAVLAGGYNELEVAIDTSLPYQDWQKVEGKSLYVLDARNGTLIKKFLPGSGANTSTVGYLVDAGDELKCAITAAPALFDSNNDGIADYMYFAESGDPVAANNRPARIWKVNCFGDPTNWTGKILYEGDPGQTIYVSPTLAYDENFRVWVLFGTGRRPQAAFGSGGIFSNTTGQFVAFIDDGTGTTLTNADLDDATGALTTAGDDVFDLVDSSSVTVSHGFFFTFFMDTNEIMFEPSPLFVANHVYFMTFSPHEGTGSTGSSDDPCGSTSSVGGMHYIYQFKLTSKGSQFAIGDFLAQSGKILGFGPMDDKWKPYFGQGEAGNFVPGTTPPIDLSNIFGPLMWKEEKK